MVNISKGVAFAFSEMLRTVKHVEGRECKKIFITANEIDSPVSRKIKGLCDGTASPATWLVSCSFHFSQNNFHHISHRRRLFGKCLGDRLGEQHQQGTIFL